MKNSRRKSEGFTLVELMITMVMFTFVIIAATEIFTTMVGQFKQQSKIAETQIEGLIGLDLLRRDIEHAGYGLPWNVIGVTGWGNLKGYTEAASDGSPDPATYNDTAPNPARAPRALVAGNNNVDVGPNSDVADYLVIKAANVALNNASHKSTNLYRVDDTTSRVREWNDLDGTLSDTRLETSDRVIVLSPGSTETNSKALVAKSDGTFHTTYTRSTNPDSLIDGASFMPETTRHVRIVYGIAPQNSDDDPPVAITPRMPFNRADYFISTANVPERCAGWNEDPAKRETGVLEKATVNHTDGGLSFLPLIDCVADMQVVLLLDMDGDGTIGTRASAYSDTGMTVMDDAADPESASVADVQATLLNADQLRQRLREVRIFILAHEGQRDPDFGYENTTITVADPGNGSLGSTFDLTTISDYEDYRWKVYKLAVKVYNFMR
jgi:type II secretory pathway pseudopilin PulG